MNRNDDGISAERNDDDAGHNPRLEEGGWRIDASAEYRERNRCQQRERDEIPESSLCIESPMDGFSRRMMECSMEEA